MTLRIVGTAIFIVLGATSAFAQSTSHRSEGFVVSAGAGIGSEAITCDDGCDDPRVKGPSGYVRIGHAVGSSLVIAGELNAWTRTEDFYTDPSTFGSRYINSHVHSRATSATLNVVALWFPMQQDGFFLNGGLGVGEYSVRTDITFESTFAGHTTGMSYQVGAGYEIGLAHHVALTPYATYFGVTKATISNDATAFGSNVVHAGVGLTLH